MFGPIKTAGVYVEDQQAALAFHTWTLGFVVRRNTPMSPNVQWLEISPPGVETSLVLYPRAMMQGWTELKPSVVFHCPHVEGACQRLESLDVRITMPATKLPWGTFAKFADPDGNEFGMTSSKLA